MTEPSVPLILKFADWPIEDRRLWDRCLGKAKLFDAAGGAFSGWSEGTRRLRAQAYGTWLSFIRRRRPELVDSPAAARATPDTVAAYIEERRARVKVRTIADQLSSLAVILRGFAPDLNRAWLFGAADKLMAQAMPRQLKPPSPLAAGDLFQWSLRRLQELKAEQSPDRWWTATEFRQALNVGLLIGCPVRARAFVAMTISKHIDVSEGGIMLTFEPQDMKDKKARRIPVPQPLAPFLLDYLNVYRPMLLDGAASDALWITRRGGQMSQDSFVSGLALLTRRTFGVTLRPHAFRHIAATSIARDAPAHSGIIRDILGHATVRMAEAHYNRATGMEVSERLQDILRERRRAHQRNRSKTRRAGRNVEQQIDENEE